MDRIDYAVNRFKDYFFDSTFYGNVLFSKSSGYC
jgi:hypothetical protein